MRLARLGRETEGLVVGREEGRGERRERTGAKGHTRGGLRENRRETELPWNYSAIEIGR